MRKYLLACWIVVGCLALPAAAAPLSNRLPAALAGETLSYDIAFLWFDRLAEGRFTFAAGAAPGTWRAELEAKTLGVAGWLTGERAQRYISIMGVQADGRLYPIYHESVILSGSGTEQRHRGKRYFFDHRSGEVRYQRLKKGEVKKEAILPFDKSAPPLDILTAFIAFRAGQAGPLLPGRRYVIPTFSHRGVADIVVETISDGERGQYPFPLQGLLVRASIDPEVFETAGGYVFLWFDEKGRPAAGIVENVIGLGNIHGKLRQDR